MPGTALAFALAAAFVHALWNILLARARNPEAATAVALVVAVVAFAPVAVAVWDVDARVWPFLVGTAAFELLYFALLAGAYRRAHLSVVYPLARGTAPVLVLVIGVAALGTATSWRQGAGGPDTTRRCRARGWGCRADQPDLRTALDQPVGSNLMTSPAEPTQTAPPPTAMRAVGRRPSAIVPVTALLV